MLIRNFVFVVLAGLTISAHADSTFQWHDVIGVKELQLQDSFWLNNLEQGNKVLLSANEISAFNQSLIKQNPFVTDPLLVANSLNKKDLIGKLGEISKEPSGKRFYPNGKQLTKEDFKRYQSWLNIESISAQNPVRFGLFVQRASLRTFPTDDRVLNSGMDADLDRFQETGAFPGESAAILHTSKDGQWYLVQTYNYLAWTRVENIAIGNKQQVADYMAHDQNLVVTGAKVLTNFVPNEPRVSQVQLDMGSRLPLMQKKPFSGALYGQNPYASYIVKLPIRTSSGGLEFKPALISKSADVQLGYLAFTKENLIRQAFKFLGERYGWGHDYNGRDCTGFVGEIYKSFGIKMPRNSGDQGSSEYGLNMRFNEQSTKAKKLAAIDNMQVGDLIYIPGHVMMYLGKYDNQPFVIHDVKGLAYVAPSGDFYRGTLNGVSVTPLLPLQLNPSTDYVDRVYNIKQIR